MVNVFCEKAIVMSNTDVSVRGFITEEVASEYYTPLSDTEKVCMTTEYLLLTNKHVESYAIC